MRGTRRAACGVAGWLLSAAVAQGADGADPEPTLRLVLDAQSHALTGHARLSLLLAAGTVLVALTALGGSLFLAVRALRRSDHDAPGRPPSRPPQPNGGRRVFDRPAATPRPVPPAEAETRIADTTTPDTLDPEAAPIPPMSEAPQPAAVNVTSAADPRTISRGGPLPESAAGVAEELEAVAAALDAEPNRAELWVRRAECHRQLGHLAQALDAYARATTLDPADAHAWIARAEVLAESGRRDAADQCLEQALAADPDHPVALVSRGRALASDRRYEDALECFEAALQARPHDPVILTNSGLCLTHIGRHEEAISYYDRAIGLAPRYGPAYQGKAHCLMRLGRQDEGIACYNHALRLKQESGPPPASS